MTQVTIDLTDDEINALKQLTPDQIADASVSGGLRLIGGWAFGKVMDGILNAPDRDDRGSVDMTFA